MRAMWTVTAAVAAMVVGLYAGIATFATDGDAPTPDAASRGASGASAETVAALAGMTSGQMGQLLVHDAPDALPVVTFLDPEGREIGFDALGGEVLLVNFWATWCAPCRAEMPSINRLATALDGAAFRVVAISLDRGGPAKPAAFLREIDADRLALYRDPSFEIAQQLEIPGLPVTLLLDRQGREVARLLGHAEWDAPEAEALVRRLIDG